MSGRIVRLRDKRCPGAPIGNPIAEISKWRWGAAPGPFRDRKYSELAAYLLTEKKADLVLLHLVCPDSFQHKHAPKSPVAYWSINYIDSRIRHITSQLRRAGRLDRTTFVLVGDHGFETVTHQIRPNLLLKKEGLLTMEGSSVQKGSDAYALSNGGSASVYILSEANKAKTAERLKKMFLQVEGVREVLDGSDFHRLGLPTPEENPEQGDLMLIPEEHYAFSGGADGSDVVVAGQHSGSHGYLPSHPRMGSIFVAWGSGIKKGVKLKSAEAVDIAPTIAALLGIEMENPDGRVLTEIFE